jgi:hypothetical protein
MEPIKYSGFQVSNTSHCFGLSTSPFKFNYALPLFSRHKIYFQVSQIHPSEAGSSVSNVTSLKLLKA